MATDDQCDLLTADLRQTMARMEAALGTIKEMILWTDEEGRLKWCNDTFARWIGKPRVLLIAKPMTELLPVSSMGQRLPNAAHPVTTALADKRANEGEYNALGNTPLHIKVTPLMMQSNISGVIVLIRDVTKEQELEEFRLRGIAISAAVNAIAILNPKGRIQWVNHAFTRMTGYTLEEVYDRSMRVLKSGKQDKSFYRNLWNTVTAGKPWEGNLINRNKSGQLYHEFQSITPVIGDNESISAFIVFKQDVTEQIRSQKALEELNEKLEQRVIERTSAVRESSALLHSLLKGLGASFQILNDRGEIVDCNSIAEERFGVFKQEAVGKQCADAYSKLDDKTRESICAATSGGSAYKEVMIRTGSGESQFAARHILDTKLNGIRHKAVVFFDITEKKNLERQLSVTQKLESIGQLASGIAHEINTPIQYVGDSIRFTKEAFEDLGTVLSTARQLYDACQKDGMHANLTEAFEDACEDADMDFLNEELPKAFDRALEGVERVADIVRAMKNFSHPGTGEKKAVDINEALQTTTTVARNEWKYVSEVKMNLDPTLPKALGMPGDLNQVILNLIVNAAHAIAEKNGDTGETGTIVISTKEVAETIQLTISDTGTGIPEEILPRVFDPFFTTKDPGKGTGQGLAIVHDIIVNKHGGSIDIQSEKGKGTTFIIQLPRYDGNKEAAQ